MRGRESGKDQFVSDLKSKKKTNKQGNKKIERQKQMKSNTKGSKQITNKKCLVKVLQK